MGAGKEAICAPLRTSSQLYSYAQLRARCNCHSILYPLYPGILEQDSIFRKRLISLSPIPSERGLVTSEESNRPHTSRAAEDRIELREGRMRDIGLILSLPVPQYVRHSVCRITQDRQSKILARVISCLRLPYL
jgi:hypothetical protein